MTRTPPLPLLEGRRARPCKVPADRPRKLALHLAVVDLLRKLGDPAWQWTHFPTHEARDARTGAELERMGTQRGWPDILLVSPAGLFHGLELRWQGEHLGEDQEAFQLWCVARGVPYAVARSLDEVMTILGAWRAVRPVAG